MISDQLKSSEYHKFYQNYIDSATSEAIVEGLIQNLESVVSFYSHIPATKHDYAYADGKWTVKDILLHVIDTERIFAYRALRIARQDRTPLAGFEQDAYVHRQPRHTPTGLCAQHGYHGRVSNARAKGGHNREY